MPSLMPTDIMDEVQHVLQSIPVNPGGRGRSYLTAYQILERLSSTTRDRLIAERGKPGLKAGKSYSAASVVSDAAEMVNNIDIAFLETSAVTIDITLPNHQIKIEPGAPNVGLYRMR